MGGNGSFPLSASQLAGANVWLLQHIADVAGVGVTYSSVVLPPALAGNRTAQVAYLFGTLGYDCLISSTPVRSDMLSVADFLLPNEQYGLSVVTQLVPGGSAPILSVLFSWTSPFSFEIWILIAASLVFGAVVMFIFEGHDRHEDYGASDLWVLLRIGRGCYKAFMNFCAVGGFTPNTPASQTFNIAFAFSMLLLQATYTVRAPVWRMYLVALLTRYRNLLPAGKFGCLLCRHAHAGGRRDVDDQLWCEAAVSLRPPRPVHCAPASLKLPAHDAGCHAAVSHHG